MGSSMKKKISKIIAGVLAAVMTVSVMPVYATDDVFESIVEEESDNAVTEPAEGDGNTEDEVMPSYFEKELLQLSKISETDTSITISWSGINNADFSHYEILCNGIAANSGITDTQYTVTGLSGGNEYGISVYAYDADENVIGMSETGYFYTDWNISSNTVLTSDKVVADLFISGETTDLNGYTLTVKGDVYLGTGTSTTYLNINKGKLYVEKNFYMQKTNGYYGEGYLIMNNAEDYICVNGDFTVYTYYARSTLTDGIIEVKGDFTQKSYNYENNFVPGGNHKVILSGVGLQTVSFSDIESRFNILDIQNFSADGVVFTTPVTILTLNRNGCNVVFANGEQSGWTLEDDDIYTGDLNLSTGTLDLNGHKLTITGNLVHSGGTVLVNGGELEVQGDYRVQSLNGTSYTTSAGVLNMTNETDTVKVLGDFVMQSTQSHSEKLTAGTLEIGGDLTQLSGGSSYNFCTSGNHTVILNGSGNQIISIANNSKDYSRINDLKIINTSADGVTFASTIYVIGDLYNTESNVINGSNIVLAGTLADNAWDHDIWLNESRALSADIEIGGNLYLNGGTLDLNGHTLTVKENFYLSASGSTTYLKVNKGQLYVNGNFYMQRTNGYYSEGYLTMVNPEDYICVNGNFTVNIWYANNTLTNGIIEVKGDFTQKRLGNAYTFNPSVSHKVILSGEALQTVNFAETESGFNILEIKNYSDEGIVFATPVTIGEIIDNGCNVSFANGERSGWTLESDETIEGNLFLARGTLDLNGHKLTVTGNLIHSGGTVLVNGGELEVQGDYRVQTLNGENYTTSAGVLNMTNETDTVKVLGDFVMQSTQSHSEKLTAGTLEIGGNLTQLSGGSAYNFCTSGNHTVILNGSEKQKVSIYYQNKTYSRFNNLRISNTSTEGVEFVYWVYVIGALYNTESDLINSSCIYVSGTTQFPDNQWNYDITFAESKTITENTTIKGDLYINSGTITLEADLDVEGNVYLNSCTLNLNGHTLTGGKDVYLGSDSNYTYLKVNKGKLFVNGNFYMQKTNGNYGYGYLTMVNPEDYICVNGNFTVNIWYANNTLTNGIIEVKGDFTQKRLGNAYTFNPSGSHKVILSGEALQTVNFAETESGFNILEIKNYSDEGIVFATPVTIGEIIDNGCNVSFANGERSGWTLESNETIEGDLFLARGTLDLNGHKLTVAGNLVHSGGTVFVNGGELEVQGDYRVQSLNGTSYTTSAGVLNMTNETDTAKVLGDFVMQSTQSHSEKLTAGTLEIGGDLTQLSGGSSYNFCTSGNHTVILNGYNEQTVSIANNSKNYSRINNLKILNTSIEGVGISRDVYIVGALYNTDSVVKNSSRIILAGTLADNVWNYDIYINENRTLSADTEIGGNLYLNGGTFDLNGYTLDVKGDYYLWSATLYINGGQLTIGRNFNWGTTASYSNGHLKMTNVDDYVLVNGNFYARSWYSQNNLTAGVLEVKGDFTQKTQYYIDNFCPAGTHKLILSGETKQTVTFDNVVSKINILEIQNYSEEGVVFATPVTINELIDNGCNVSFVNGERAGWTLESDETIEGDLFLARGTLDLNGHKLTVTGNLVHSGGTVFVNGGELEVQKDYRVQTLNGENYTTSAGVLNMTNETDTVKVLGDFVMHSTQSHSEKLTAGTLEIGGDLTQLSGGSAYNFCTSGNHTVILNGSGNQIISIANNSKDYSRINDLKIINTSADGVTFASTIYVIGDLYNTESNVINGSNIVLAGTLADNAWDHDIWLNESRTLSADIEIGENLYLNGGTLDLNGHTLTVKENFYLSASGSTTYLNVNKGQMYVNGNFNMQRTNGSYGYGYLIMKNAEDYICVNGDFTVYTYYSYSTLTNGTIEVKGNFTQKYYNRTNNFAPSGSHKVVLSGVHVQKVNFAAVDSQFNILEITKSIDTGYVFSRTPLWNILVEGTPDREPPTAPKGLEFVHSTSSSVMVSWKASSDNKSVLCYYIYRDGELIGRTDELQYIDNGLTSHTSYVYYVTACDVDGNESAWSNIIEVSTDADAFAPTQPANFSAIVRSEGVIYLSWTGSSDNGSVEYYNIYRNGAIIGTSNGTSYSDDTASGGVYEYYVEAVDNEGNISRASESVTVDNLAPSAPVLIVGSVNDLYVRLNWTGYDNLGVVKYEIYKNDVKIKSVETETYIDLAIELDKTYSYYVIAYDAYGNASEKSNIEVVYTGSDDEAPEITEISAVSSVISGNAVINVTAQDNCGISEIGIEVSNNNSNWENAGTVKANKGTCENAGFAVDTTAYPDGKLYIRAYAEDLSGNVSSLESSPVCEITTDNTAPDKIKNLTSDVSSSRIEIKWSAPENDDAAYFRIYRKTDTDNDFILIKDNYKYLNYFDTNIELGVEYNYKVSSVDNCGNESVLSDPITAGIAEDKVVPEVLSIYPENGAVLDTNQIVGVSARDNFRLKDIIVECRAAGGEWITVYTEENIDVYAKAVQFELDTSDFKTGIYELRAYAHDTAENVSSYVVGNYTFKECALSAPVLAASGEGWRNELSWTMENTEDLLGYHIYRKTLSSADYSLIASVKDSQYTDGNVTPNKTYYYMVEAVDSRNNYVKSNEITSVPTDNDDILPLADAGFDVMGIVGESIAFSGTNSWDNHYVASYKWDFGDGSSASGVKASHSYKTDGTYTVTLTVTDSAGNTDSHTINSYIYSSDYGSVKIKVTDESNRILSDVKVYCELPNSEKTDYSADANGNFRLIAPKGDYDVYFYKNGYLPQYVPVTVTDDNTVLTVKLKEKELVEGKITVTPLDIDEIVELGIDVNAPENQFVYEYSITYDEQGTLKFTLNATGDIIGEVTGTIQKERNGVFTTVATITGEKDRAVSVEYGKYASGGGGIPVSVAVFNVTTEVSWLKEFYDVELTIINNADGEFSIQSSQAVLDLPDGLSLADTSRKENLIRIMGDNGVIGGQETQSVSWIVRGDKPGSYDLSAEFTGVLMPFNEDVKVVFKTEEPLVVHDGTGLKLDITVTEGLKYWSSYFEFTNNSDRPIYNFAASFSGSSYLAEVTDMIVKYPSGATEIIKWNNGVPDTENSELYIPVLATDFDNPYASRTINPGETVTGYFSIERQDGFTNDN